MYRQGNGSPVHPHSLPFGESGCTGPSPVPASVPGKVGLDPWQRRPARRTRPTQERAERARKALRLRASGIPYAQVALECGYPSEDAAKAALRRFMAKEDQAAREDARAIHRERIETLLRSLWLAAINPGMAQQAAREAGHPAPPTQERAVELLIRLLDQSAKVEGIYSAVKAEVSGADGGPIEGRIDVLAWKPDREFMVMYAQVLRDAGLLDVDAVEGEARYLDPGVGDPEVEPE